MGNELGGNYLKVGAFDLVEGCEGNTLRFRIQNRQFQLCCILITA